MKYGFISWLSFFSYRQAVSGPHSPIDRRSVKGGCKALRFCCSSRTRAGRVWPVRTHWPRWTTEKGPVCRATTGTPTHIQLCSLSLSHTHILSPTTRKCQLLPNSTDDLPILIELPSGETNTVEWQRRSSNCTQIPFGFVLRHLMCTLFISCVQNSCLVSLYTVYNVVFLYIL